MSKIRIPAYVSGSDFSSIHTMGSIRGFWQCQGPKWIRWSGRQVRPRPFSSKPFIEILELTSTLLVLPTGVARSLRCPPRPLDP